MSAKGQSTRPTLWPDCSSWVWDSRTHVSACGTVSRPAGNRPAGGAGGGRGTNGRGAGLPGKRSQRSPAKIGGNLIKRLSGLSVSVMAFQYSLDSHRSYSRRERGARRGRQHHTRPTTQVDYTWPPSLRNTVRLSIPFGSSIGSCKRI